MKKDSPTPGRVVVVLEGHEHVFEPLATVLVMAHGEEPPFELWRMILFLRV